jgi:hypothetical protein
MSPQDGTLHLFLWIPLRSLLMRLVFLKECFMCRVDTYRLGEHVFTHQLTLSNHVGSITPDVLPDLVSSVFSLASFFTFTGRSPDILSSPRRIIWGQDWKVFMKKGLVTPE